VRQPSCPWGRPAQCSLPPPKGFEDPLDGEDFPITPAENIGTGATVWIDNFPPQVYLPDPAAHIQVSDTPCLILRKSIEAPSNQLNESTSNDTNFSTDVSTEEDIDKVIQDKSS
jgi:hypothetical protein